MEKKPAPSKRQQAWKNEGEGSASAAKRYDEAARKFAREGEVEEKAEEAKRAVERDEEGELRRAEEAGKRRIAEEDPLLRK